MKSKSLTLNGKKVSYFDEGQGFPIVMVYGWVVCKYAFEPVGDLLKKDFRIIVPDLPGHGDSEELDEKHSFKNYLQFLDQFLNKIIVRNFHLMGASLGGTLALLYTLQNEKKVNKLILHAPVISWKQLPGNLKVPLLKPVIKTLGNIGFLQKKWHDRFRDYAFSTRLPRLKSHLAPGRWKEVGKSVKAVLDAYDNKLSRRASSEFGLAILGVDLWNDLRKIDKETLIIWGENDSTLDKSDGKKIEKLMPRVKYVEIKDGSHDVLVEKHREIAKEVKKFLS